MMSDVAVEQSAEIHKRGSAASGAHGHDHEQLRAENLKFAWWIYLASEVIIFTVFIVGYVLFRVNEPDAVKAVHDDVGIALVTFNTFLLLMSSWAMVMGLRQIQLGNPRGLMTWLGATAALGTVFVALQYVEYRELAHLGIALGSISEEFSGFGMRFYAPTAFHGAHVVVGVLWCLYVIRRAAGGHYSPTNYSGVEVFGLYWHFVDVVWIILFTLIYLV